MTDMESAKWGMYAPLKTSVFLRALIKIGLSRGAVRAKILKKWKKQYGNMLDITVRGIRYRLNLSDNVTDAKIFASSVIYDKEELSFLKQYCRGGVFVDIGANTGYYSLVLAKEAAARVLAIEVNPPTLERLQFNVQINNDLKNKIQIVPIGVGEEGVHKIYSSGNLGGASLHRDLLTTSAGFEAIRTKPLYDILTENDIQRIDAMKIDIEGMEDRALSPFFKDAPGSVWPKCIVFEESHHHMWETDIMKMMIEIGYIEVSRTSGNVMLHLKGV